MNDEINIPIEEEIQEDEDIKEPAIEEGEGGNEIGILPNIPSIPPMVHSNDEEEDEDSKNKRGRPKTIPAKTACAKSMLFILKKLKRIQDKTLQDDVKELAEDAILELKHLHDNIDSVL